MNKISLLSTFCIDQTLKLDLHAYTLCASGQISFICSRINYHKVQDQVLASLHEILV